MSAPLKNATLRQLATFHTLARLRSISQTAEEMHLTQPAVSLQIGILEESAGTPLLTRSARGVKLTEAGELLDGYAQRMLSLWREASEAMAAQRGMIAGTLRIGAVTTAEYLLPHVLLEFVKLHPKVKVKLQVGNRAEVTSALAVQEVDLALMGRPPSELRATATAFARHPMAFIAAPTHPVLQLAAPTLADLNECNLLVRERGSGTRNTVEALYREAGLDVAIGAELSSNEAIKQMCAAGFGVAFLSMHACVLELQAGVLVQVPLPGQPVERDWYVIALAGRPMPAAAAAFETFLREQGPALIDQRRYQPVTIDASAEATAPAKKPRTRRSG